MDNTRKNTGEYETLKDFFISYAVEDRKRAKWVQQRLEAHKYTTIFAEHDFPAGSNFILEIQKALKMTKRVIAITSPAYFNSQYCQMEWADVLRRDPTGEKRLLIPVMIKPCEDKSLIGSLLRINLIGKDDEEALRHLLREVRRLPDALTNGNTPLSMPNPFPSTSQVPQSHVDMGTLLHTSGFHIGAIHSLAWSPDNRFLASAGSDKTVFVRDNSTQQEKQLPGEYTRTVHTLGWSPDSTVLAVGGEDGYIDLWDVASLQKRLTYRGHLNAQTGFLSLDSWIFTLAWSPDGKWIASGGADTTVHVWRASTGECSYVYHGHGLGQDASGYHPAAPVSSLAWSPDGKRIASASQPMDNSEIRILKAIPLINLLIPDYVTIHVWDALTGNNVIIYAEHIKGVNSLAWSPDGCQVASASKDRTVHVWKPEQQRASRYAQGAIYRDHTNQVNAVTWSPDGAYIASAGKDSTVQIWKPATGERVYTYRGHTGCVTALAWSPKNDMIASADDKGVICLWKA